MRDHYPHQSPHRTRGSTWCISPSHYKPKHTWRYTNTRKEAYGDDLAMMSTHWSFHRIWVWFLASILLLTTTCEDLTLPFGFLACQTYKECIDIQAGWTTMYVKYKLKDICKNASEGMVINFVRLVQQWLFWKRLVWMLIFTISPAHPLYLWAAVHIKGMRYFVWIFEYVFLKFHVSKQGILLTIQFKLNWASSKLPMVYYYSLKYIYPANTIA